MCCERTLSFYLKRRINGILRQFDQSLILTTKDPSRKAVFFVCVFSIQNRDVNSLKCQKLRYLEKKQIGWVLEPLYYFIYLEFGFRPTLSYWDFRETGPGFFMKCVQIQKPSLHNYCLKIYKSCKQTKG